jgi:hypothetical protein
MDAGIDAGTGSDASVVGDAAISDSGVDSSARADGGPIPTAAEDSGCGCRTVRVTNVRHVSLPITIAMLAMLAIRRRATRRRSGQLGTNTSG